MKKDGFDLVLYLLKKIKIKKKKHKNMVSKIVSQERKKIITLIMI